MSLQTLLFIGISESTTMTTFTTTPTTTQTTTPTTTQTTTQTTQTTTEKTTTPIYSTTTTTTTYVPPTIPTYTLPTIAPPTPEPCKDGAIEIAEDSPYFGPKEDESSPSEDNLFTNPDGDEIVVTLKFNAYQVIDADIERIFFDAKNVTFKSAEVHTMDNQMYNLQVSNNLF